VEEFKSAWDTIETDGVISLAEFCDYYKDVSPGVGSDAAFANMVRNTWGL